MGCIFDPAIAAIEIIGILEVLVSVLVDADEGAGLQIIVSVYLRDDHNQNFCNLYKMPGFGISLTCKASGRPASSPQPRVWPGTACPGD